jgi:hypothetical protein
MTLTRATLAGSCSILVLSQPPDAVEDSVVLGRGGKHPPAALVIATPRPVQALDREVVCLGAAAGEDDFARPGAVSLGDQLT